MEFANEKKHCTNGYVPNLSFTLTKTKHTGNFFVMDMGERDVIIGMYWLLNNHALIDCEKRNISFQQTK